MPAAGQVALLPTLILQPEDFTGLTTDAQLAARLKSLVDEAIGAADFAGGTGSTKGIFYGNPINAESVHGNAGLSGVVIVWDIDAQATPDGLNYDFSGVTVKVMPYQATLVEQEGESVITATHLERTAATSGPENTTEHESWHVNGIPPAKLVELAAQLTRLTGKIISLESPLGLKEAAKRRIESLKSAMESTLFTPTPGQPLLTDADAQAKAMELAELWVIGGIARDEIVIAGVWHGLRTMNGGTAFYKTRVTVKARDRK